MMQTSKLVICVDKNKIFKANLIVIFKEASI